MRKAITCASFCITLLTGLVGHSYAASEEIYKWSFDAVTIERGYTISSPDNGFFVGVLPGVLKGETDVTIKIFDHTNYRKRELYQVNASALEDEAVQPVDDSSVARAVVDWPLPEGKEILTPIYEFDIKGAKDLYNPEKPLWLRIHYPVATQETKGVYFYDKGRGEWVEIPADLYKKDQSYRSAIHLTYAPIAILGDSIPETGEASWYRYHGCNCAASRDYPTGSLLTVTDLNTEKSVIVEVNDYGPEIQTGRIIDLDLVAFEQLTEKWRGLTNVRVEPFIITEEDFHSSDGLPSHFNEI